MEVSKEKMIELVNNAPEGATHYKFNVDTYLAVRGNVNAFIHGEWVILSTLVDLTMEFVSVIKLDYSVLEDKPVYTQEMADNGGLPPAGSEFEVWFDFDSIKKWHVAVMTNHFDNGFSIDCGDYSHCYLSDDGMKFRPIDTRTDQEKLIDEISNMLHTKGFSHDELMLKCLMSHGYITRKGESNE